jgi:DNA end-binding protein Ku
MGRSMWTGVISFGMVTIPVKLHTATESHSISFHLLHEKCDTRIKEMRWCPHCERKVEWDEIVKGYEYAKDKYVEVTAEDLEKLPLPSKHTIEVSDFVAAQEIDPLYFDSCYYLEVEKSAQKPFKLLLEVLEEKDMAGIATIAFRNKERLCALRSSRGTLILQTLLYDDEIKDNDSAPSASVKVSPQEKKMASSLIDNLTTKFEPQKYKDKYQSAMKKLINAKLKGVELKEPEQRQSTNATDLMEALRASIEHLSKGKSSLKTAELAESNKSAKRSAKGAAKGSNKGSAAGLTNGLTTTKGSTGASTKSTRKRQAGKARVRKSA